MGLILCESVKAGNPFYISVLNLHIYSFEELCYIIYENPILITLEIVNDALVNFIENELKIEQLATNIKKRIANGAKPEEILIYIIEYCDLYNNTESINYRNSIARLKKMTDWELLKYRGDYMFYIGKYNLSKEYYLEILKNDIKADNGFIGSVYHNLGVSYANLFLYEEAYSALKTAYELIPDSAILMEIYFLKKIFHKDDENNRDDMKLFNYELLKECENTFQAAINGVGESAKLNEVEALFNVEDRNLQKKLIGECIDNWKKEYRNMK